jgi:hypothetical protein
MFVYLLTLRSLSKCNLQYCKVSGWVSLSTVSTLYPASNRVNMEPCELLKRETYERLSL